jgi:hypothetical protein
MADVCSAAASDETLAAVFAQIEPVEERRAVAG